MARTREQARMHQRELRARKLAGVYLLPSNNAV